jgi:hypothetical protein
MFGAKKFNRVTSAFNLPAGGNGDLRAFAQTMLATATMSSPSAAGTLTINGVSLGSYDYIVKQGAHVISAFTSADWFTATQDTRSAWIVINGNLTINAGITVIPAVRKLFTVVYVQGNLTLNGNISMSLRGANHSGTGTSGGAVTAAAIRIATGTFSGVSNPTILSAGGNGGSGATLSNQFGGVGVSAGSSIRTGGGGGGPKASGNTANPGWVAGFGGNGTCFSGGSGGGSFADFFQTATGSASPGGASGGAGGAGMAGGEGGVGNPSPSRLDGNSTADNGTGGVLVVIASGAITGAGTLSAVGGNQTAVSASPAPNSGVCGGASGGGLVCLMGASVSGPTLTAAGGTATATGYAPLSGGAGGAGYTGTLIIP